MNPPNVRLNDDEEVDAGVRPLKKRKKPLTKRDRKYNRAIANIPDVERADISTDIPGGYVDGDRIFYNGSEGEPAMFSEILGGRYGPWQKCGEVGVRWGEGSGGVWVHTRRPKPGCPAWEVLSMELPRLESLHKRNVTQLKKNRKPVTLPARFDYLFKDRDEAVQEAKKAKEELERLKFMTDQRQESADANLTEMQAQIARKGGKSASSREKAGSSSGASRSSDAAREIEELAAQKLADVEAQFEARLAEESRLTREAKSETGLLRAERIEAVARMKKLEDLKEREVRELKKVTDEAVLQKDNLDVSIQALEGDLCKSKENERKAREQQEQLAQACAKRDFELEAARTRAERYETTFGIEAGPSPFIDLEADSDLPPVLEHLKREVLNPDWVGYDESGNSTNWLGFGWELVLRMRSRNHVVP